MGTSVRIVNIHPINHYVYNTVANVEILYILKTASIVGKSLVSLGFMSPIILSLGTAFSYLRFVVENFNVKIKLKPKKCVVSTEQIS